MKLVSLKLTKKEAKEEVQGPATSGAPKYPYGTRLRLDADMLKRLKLDVTDMKVGDEFTITAKGRVCELEEYESEKNERCNASIQITDMAVEEGDGKKEERRAGHLNEIGSATR